ncbi:hypothetical protein [Chitinophaga qingshengii]|uniref:PTS sugar transporter subunit IIBC n=1 Tax=Chitinophaga qingshengii TaxID=1569794 RepID=A0ABR7TJF2_9BACT|nr:hypothetical protein [Chitinophaga qingshengii]MBC9930120.1 hypothetical protein [Chitinophaga qingshengii]
MKDKKLTPKQAVAILANEGITVSEEDAEKILELIYYLAEISIKQVLNSDEFD